MEIFILSEAHTSIRRKLAQYPRYKRSLNISGLNSTGCSIYSKICKKKKRKRKEEKVI